MARVKRASDELYNARRRAKRLATRLERKGNIVAATNLRALVGGSYGKGAQVGVSELDKAVSGYGSVTTDGATKSKVTSATPRQPRQKRVSDELYNARRRIRREADRLVREAKELTGAAKDAALDFARNLRERAQAGGKLDRNAQIETIRRLSNVFERSRRTRDMKVARSNMIWMQQINAAGTRDADSSISERKKDVFWAAVKGLWPQGSHVPRNERYDRILDHFYSDNTSDARAFRSWLSEVKKLAPSDVFGSLQYVYEYITEKLNDPAIYDLPELPYASVMDLVRTAM